MVLGLLNMLVSAPFNLSRPLGATSVLLIVNARAASTGRGLGEVEIVAEIKPLLSRITGPKFDPKC
jgi:hypothetical protein